ncbi:MAG: hypothetical protein ACKPBV_10400 [Sphaerospermopsis kisseleviana]
MSSLGTSTGFVSCVIGALVSPNNVCTGDTSPSINTAPKTGPVSFGGSTALFPASSASGLGSIFLANFYYGIDSSYIVGQPFLSSATFNNTNLAAQGFTLSGLLGTWTINGTTESINVIIGPPSTTAATPGPLPLLGAGASFAWSRRLRKRIATPRITLPRA